MTTPVFCCGLECGNISGGGTPHWSLNNTGSISTTTVRSGARSFRFNPTTLDGSADSTALTASNVMVVRAYVRFATLPNVDCQILEPTGVNCGAYFKASDSKIYAGEGAIGAFTFGASGVAVTTGQWYLIEMRSDTSGGSKVIDVRVDGVDCAQYTHGTGGATPTKLAIGVNGISTTADVFFDDILISQTSADYPIGAGHVLSFIPAGDGTHNVAGANDFERTLTGTDITNSTTDAYTLIDDRPLPTTAVDFINGIAPPNATDYVEWTYEQSSESTAPRFVDVILVVHDAGGAGTCSYSVTLRRNTGGASDDIFNGTQNVGATITYRRKAYATAPGGATWTTAIFNDLRSRFLVADASPDPYIDAIMLETEFSDASGSTFTVNVSGATTSSGAIAKSTTKLLSGASTSTGAVQKATTRLLSGAMASAGALVKTTTKLLAGATTSSGAIASLKIKILALAGATTSAGTLAKSTTKLLAGSTTSAGTLAKVTTRAFAGAMASSGTLIKTTTKLLAGAMTSAGTLVVSKVKIIALSGATTSAGALQKATTKVLAGSTTSAGALAKATTKVLSGATTSAGTMRKATTKLLAGATTSTGALATSKVKIIALAGSMLSAGTLVKSTTRNLAGLMASIGSLLTQITTGSGLGRGSALVGTKASASASIGTSAVASAAVGTRAKGRAEVGTRL